MKKNKIYIRYMNSKCTGMNLNYFYIISSLVIISIIYIASTSSYNSNTYKKYIKLRLQLNSQDNFTNIDDSNIKDNHKLMYWIAPLNNDIHNIKDNFGTSGVTNILNNSSLIDIDCSKNNTNEKYVHFRIVDSDGKLSGVYINKNNISKMCNI